MQTKLSIRLPEIPYFFIQEVEMRNFKISVFIVLITCFLMVPQAFSSSPAQEQLKSSIDQIVQILKDPSLKGDENKTLRRDALRKIIYTRFDFEKMSQLSLAKHWKNRSDEEKKNFIWLFSSLLEDTYVSKIETYTDEKVEYTKELVKQNKAQIYTKIITDSVEIPIDYRMYQTKKGDWMVYDIVVEGVSLIGNYRSQFDQILQKDSYDQLVKQLEEKTGKPAE